MTDHTCTKHQPGSNACYSLHRCRCTPCRTARATTAKAARLRRDTGRGLTPSAPILAHIHQLRTTMSITEIAHRAGLPHGSLNIRTERIQYRTAAAILAVQPEPTATYGLVTITGTRRRLQALARIGWSTGMLAPHLGVQHAQAVWQWRQGPPQWVTTETRARVLATYNQLWDQRPIGATADRSRRFATSRAWPPPMAWDDDQIDNPNAQPSGHLPDNKRGNTTADLIDAIEFGASLANLTNRFDLQPDSIYTALKRADRTDLWRRISPRMQPETRAA